MEGEQGGSILGSVDPRLPIIGLLRSRPQDTLPHEHSGVCGTYATGDCIALQSPGCLAYILGSVDPRLPIVGLLRSRPQDTLPHRHSGVGGSYATGDCIASQSRTSGGMGTLARRGTFRRPGFGRSPWSVRRRPERGVLIGCCWLLGVQFVVSTRRTGKGRSPNRPADGSVHLCP